MVLNVFKSGIFPLQSTESTGNPGILVRATKISDPSNLKILTPKQTFQKLPKDLRK